MVLFDVAGTLCPLDDATVEALAVAFRLDAREPQHGSNIAGAAALADAIEAALVGEDTSPIVVDEDAAEALLWRLNRTLRDPDTIDPAYSLYLEVRRSLGRLFS